MAKERTRRLEGRLIETHQTDMQRGKKMEGKRKKNRTSKNCECGGQFLKVEHIHY